MAMDVVDFSIAIESKDKIFSLLQTAHVKKLNIIFPLFLYEGKQYVFLLNKKKPFTEFQNWMEGFVGSTDPLYFLQINSDYILTIQPLFLQLVCRQSLVECTDEEGLFFEEILKKLDQYCQTHQSSLISHFYLNIFLQCFNDVLIREKAFKLREELLAKNFLKLLQNENNYMRQVQNYAEKLFVSRRYLTKAVHNTLGQPPKLLIDLQIICKAKKLLATRYTVYEIAEQLTFENSASFSVFFKRHTGNTPTEYRQKIINT